MSLIWSAADRVVLETVLPPVFGKEHYMKDFQNNRPSPPTNPPTFPEDGGLVDGRGRRITYLRLAITDRCNLRCRYCRPEDGVPSIPHKEILRFEELERLVAIFCSLGINKVRVTGGEPFARRGCLPFLKRLGKIDGVQKLHITTNGVKTSRYLNELSAMGIDGINLSLDTLDQKKFWKITRRDYLEAVLQTLHGALAWDIPLKINSVVLSILQKQALVNCIG